MAGGRDHAFETFVNRIPMDLGPSIAADKCMKNHPPSSIVSFEFRTFVASLLTVAVTISSCGPGNRKGPNPAPVGQVQKLSGTQMGEDQPVQAESMQELERDWSERRSPPSHQRVRVETKAEHIYETERDQDEVPRLTPAQVSDSVLPEAELEAAEEVAPTVPKENLGEPLAVTVAPVVPTPSASDVPKPPPVPPVVAGNETKEREQEKETEKETEKEKQVEKEKEQRKESKESQRTVPGSSDPQTTVIAVDPKTFVLDRSYRTTRVRIFPHLYLLPGESIGRSSRPEEVRISNKGGIVLIDERTQKELTVATDAHFFFQRNVIRAQGMEFPLARTLIVPLREEHLTEISDIEVSIRNKMRKLKAYRGKFLIANVPVPVGRTKTGGFAYASHWSVINFVDFEDYVVSVVPNEIRSDSAAQAIRAQAIASRTYGVYHAIRARERNQEYDLEATTMHQVYGGYSVEDKKLVTPHVDATQGEILTDLQGRAITANFSANSGGHTCSALECFGQATSYLQAVPDIDGVRQRSGGQRVASMSKSQLTKAYLKAFPDSGKTEKTFEVLGLDVLERTESQRVKRVRVRAQIPEPGKASAAGDLDLDFKQTAVLLGALGFRQRYLDFSTTVSGVKVMSYGFGHGVGLSQQGATIHAEKGADAYQILRFYYRNTQVMKISNQVAASALFSASAPSKR